MELFQKTVEEQCKIGKFSECIEYLLKAIAFAEAKPEGLTNEDAEFYFSLLMYGIEALYKLRRI
jgi:hypothetical protein